MVWLLIVLLLLLLVVMVVVTALVLGTATVVFVEVLFVAEVVLEPCRKGKNK
jgi:hypothetical protein